MRSQDDDEAGAARPVADPPTLPPDASKPLPRVAVVVGALLVVAIAGWMVQEFLSRRPPSRPETVFSGPPKTWPAEFPRASLTEGLLGPPQALEGDVDDAWFGQGPDGQEALWLEDGRRLIVLDESLSWGRQVTLPEDYRFHSWFAPGTAPMDLLLWDFGERGREIAALKSDGSLVWSWGSSRPSIEASTLLYGAEGITGVVLGVGGKEGLVALDLHGKPLWNVPRVFVVYDVDSHPDLPGYTLQIGGGALLLFAPAGAEEPRIVLGSPDSRGEFDAGTYVAHGRLIPGSDGEPAMLLTGQLGDAPPVLVRATDAGRVEWRATLPSEADAIELVEPPGVPRLLVVTTEAGELLVVDEHGTLRARQSLPDARPEEHTHAYGLSAGEFRPGSWGVVVKLLRKTYVFSLHPERLK